MIWPEKFFIAKIDALSVFKSTISSRLFLFAKKEKVS